MIYSINGQKFDSDFLEHFGIKGMKWGVRRYQNSDGTWTEEGLRLRRQQRNARELARAGRIQQAKEHLHLKGYNKGAYSEKAIKGELRNDLAARGKELNKSWKEYERLYQEWETLDDKLFRSGAFDGVTYDEFLASNRPGAKESAAAQAKAGAALSKWEQAVKDTAKSMVGDYGDITVAKEGYVIDGKSQIQETKVQDIAESILRRLSIYPLDFDQRKR